MQRISIISLFIILWSCTCTAQLSGPLNGTYGPGTYTVVGDISVESGDSLIILPGTTFQFQGALNLSFDVYGYLYAVGTQTDSITFKPESPGDTWTGIDFNDSSDDSNTLEYCLVTGSTASGVDCFSAGPTISRCTVRDNTANFGGGIYASGANPTITNCIITGNSTNVCGAGIWASSSNIIIADCYVADNNAGNSAGGIYCYSTDAVILNCTVTGNTSIAGAGGIFCRYANQTISHCIITDNSTETVGGGICCIEATTTIERCLITGNFAGLAGGGIEAYVSTPTITNCTISGNTAVGLGGGIESFDSSPIIVNTIVDGNFGEGGIYFFNGLYADVSYCDLHNNQGGNFLGYTPPELGQTVAVNANGDSCDVYSNIFEDPLFYALSGDSAFYLTENSPCIDAGDPDSPSDPDETVADIGVFFYDQGVTSPVSITLTPQNPPIIVPAGGGIFSYSAEIGNSGITPQTFDIWIMVTLPTGGQFGPVLGPVNLTLQSGFSLIRDREQGVPANAPPGIYVYEGRIGDYPDDIWGSDSFTFIKSTTVGDNFYGYWSNIGQNFGSMGENNNHKIPNGTALVEVYPNPFNLETTIKFTLAKGGNINLALYDVSGRRIKTLVSGWRQQGVHEIGFDAKELPSGIYIYRLKSSINNESGKIMLLK